MTSIYTKSVKYSVEPNWVFIEIPFQTKPTLMANSIRAVVQLQCKLVCV